MTKRKTVLPPAEEGFSLISNRKLLALYAAMVECRRIAEGSSNRSGGKRADSLLGDEATAVGAAIDLLAQDTVAAADWPDEALQAINPVVALAPGASVAANAARAEVHGRRITMLFSSRKQRRQSSWLKALSVAAADNLPILFVSLAHGKAGSAPFSAASIRTKRRGYALPHISVDGNDVVAVFRVASEAIAHARKGHGPTLIDCLESDSGDPVRNMEKYLSSKGLSLR